MKVAIFSDAYKPTVSGVVTAVEALAQGLQKKGVKVQLFVPAYPGFCGDETGNIFRFQAIKTKVDFPLAFPFSKKGFKLFSFFKPDIVHCNHPYLLGRTGALWAKKLGCPTVATLHTNYVEYLHYIPLPFSITRRLAIWALKDFTSKCSHIITPAETARQRLVSYGITTPITVIPNAVNIEEFEGKSPKLVRQKYAISNEDIVLIFVGRLALEKNVLFLLKILRAIPEDSVKLMLVGGGPQEEELKKFAKENNLEHRCIFTGAIPHKDISLYYAACDIFVSASTTEVHPIVLIEAMASKLPVIAFDSPGYKDTIRDGEDGILTKPDFDDFLVNLKELIHNPALRQNLAHNAKIRSQQYSISTYIDRVINLYQEVIRKYYGA